MSEVVGKCVDCALTGDWVPPLPALRSGPAIAIPPPCPIPTNRPCLSTPPAGPALAGRPHQPPHPIPNTDGLCLEAWPDCPTRRDCTLLQALTSHFVPCTKGL
eukprot:1160050-Pelagomonas_calceolata.AAC.7